VNPQDPLFTASQRMHGMAGETGNQKLGYVLTGLSVALVAIMALREFKELFGDKGFKQWESHKQRHEKDQGRGR
jgi:hypothetical protein